MVPRRVLAPGVSFVIALFVSLTAARTQHAAAPATTTATTNPTTAPDPIVDNPHYLAWAKYKPGTQVELDLNALVGGQSMTTNVTMTLHEVTPRRAIVESVAKLNIPGLPNGDVHKQTHTFNAKVPQSQARRAMLPPGGEGEMKEIGMERIDVAGKTYDATVSAFSGTIQDAPAEAKQWRTDDVPGGLVKMETSGGNMKVEMILKKVTTK